MTETGQDLDTKAKRLELSTKYWLKRLDHTLTHTQTASRLIYVVDGAVLALIYFVIQAFGASRQIILFMSVTAILLMVLNLLHARFVIIQREHYRAIDAKLLLLLDQQQVKYETERKTLASTHGIYCMIHIAIALFVAIAAAVMLLYGLGYFSEVKLLKPS